MKMSIDPDKYKVVIKQYSRSILGFNVDSANLNDVFQSNQEITLVLIVVLIWLGIGCVTHFNTALVKDLTAMIR